MEIIKITDIFRKGLMIRKIDRWKYEIRDLIDDSVKTVEIYGKMKLSSMDLEIERGKTIYFMKCQYENWRLILDDEFDKEAGENLNRLKSEISQLGY